MIRIRKLELVITVVRILYDTMLDERLSLQESFV